MENTNFKHRKISPKIEFEGNSLYREGSEWETQTVVLQPSIFEPDTS